MMLPMDRIATLLVLLVATMAASSPVMGIVVDGAFVKPQTLDAAAITAMPHVSMVVDEEHGEAHAAYSGVLLAALIGSLGAPTGAAIKGAPARSYVVVRAADGYSAVFSLAELDSTEAKCAPILADARDGQPVPSPIGPFRLIAPCDKTQARWVREVTGFTIVTIPDARRVE